MMVFQTLNRLKWQDKLHEAEIIIVHRGAPENRKIIKGSRITELKKGYFYYKSENREIYIPLHRVVEIRQRGKILWRKSS